MALSPNINTREFEKFISLPEGTTVKTVSYVDTSYSTITERVNSQLTYFGKAIAGSLTSQSVWQISREYTIGTKTYYDYVDSGNFTQIWDDRSTLFTTPVFFNQYSTNFDGINDNINFSDSFSTYDAGTAFTMSFWLNINNVSSQRCIYSKTTNDVNVYGLSIQVTTGAQIFIQARTPGYLTSHTSTMIIPVASWTHLAVTYNGGNNLNGFRVYIDGVVDVTPSSFAIGASLYSGQNALLGIRNAAFPFSGYIDEVTFWNKSLTSTEVTELYNSGAPFSPQDHSALPYLEHWYRMGDDDTYNVITDNVGSVDGTMTNMTSDDFETVVP